MGQHIRNKYFPDKEISYIKPNKVQTKQVALLALSNS